MFKLGDMLSLDKLNEQIIELLGRDARQSSKRIAKKLNISPSTARRRINSLHQRGVLHTVSLVEPSRAGFPLVALIGFEVAHDRVKSIMEVLIKQNEVKWVANTTGRYNIMILARFHSTEEVSQFMQEGPAGMEGVKDTEMFICLHVRKGRYMPL